MIITGLKLANVRAIDTAEFSFQPGINLLVGVNGAGKSTILDVIRIALSRILPKITSTGMRPIAFATSDISVNLPFLDATVEFTLGGESCGYTRRQWSESVAADDETNLERLRRQILESDRLRDRARNLLRELAESHGVSDSDAFTPSISQLKAAATKEPSAPNCVFFSTSRAVVARAAAKKARTAGGGAFAYADALVARSWHVAEFSSWMRVQQELEAERPVARKHLSALAAAARMFLPGYENLRPDAEDPTRLLVDRKGVPIEVSQLSDGERGVLGMVLDLGRRLSLANPELDDPLRQSSAVVLIDEIDLHLHPAWQRQIVKRLTETFPACQFIATTHSPQVIGEVHRDAIQLMSAGGIKRPAVAFGADSNWILDHVMEGASAETSGVRTLIGIVEDAMAEGNLPSARSALEKLRRTVDGETGEIARLEGGLTTLELLAKDSAHQGGGNADD